MGASKLVRKSDNPQGLYITAELLDPLRGVKKREPGARRKALAKRIRFSC
jgi:hypothetical protein